MTKVDSIDAQNHWAEILTRVGANRERVVIEQEGQAVAAIISYEELKRFEAWENEREAAQLSSAISEDDGEFVTLEEVIEGYNELHGTDFTVESIVND